MKILRSEEGVYESSQLGKRRLARQWPSIALAIIVATESFSVAAQESAYEYTDVPTVDESSVLIKDENGRTAYIVELLSNTATYATNFQSERRFQSYHKGNVVNFVRDLESQYDFEASTMTSWSSVSFTAFLEDWQLQALWKDRRVANITPDVRMHFSDVDTTAVWADSVVTLAAPPNALWTPRIAQSTEMQPWGKRAVNQTTTTSSGSTAVYVIDAGVGQHVDLNVHRWVNAVDHSNDCTAGSCTAAKLKKLVGCYTHATAVAGVIGARSNGTGIVGINPGVKIVSVSILDPAAATATSTCLPSGSSLTSASRVKSALDWVESDIVANNYTGKPSVVNLSMNWSTPSQWPAGMVTAIKADMAALGSSTPGALVVQSAGNQYAAACTYAYGPRSASDGVMVVGAINNHGQPVVPLSGANGFWKSVDADGAAMGHEKGSNYGSCVDVWAPGDATFTTIGNVGQQRGDTTYNTYGYGSGTSFAAPHVAGLAAYLIENNALTTPAAVEAKLRNASILSSLGSVDPSGEAIKMPTQNPLPIGVPRSTVYAEYVLARSCIWPSFAAGSPPAGCKQLALQDPSYISTAARNRGTLILNGSPNVWMTFDSYGNGSASCTQRVLNALGGGTTINTGNRYYSTAALIGGNQYATSSCTSAHMTVVF